MRVNDWGRGRTLQLEYWFGPRQILEVNARREWNDNAGARRGATRMTSAPLVPRDPETALPGALAPEPLLCGEVALLEPAAVGRPEEQLLAALRGIEGEHLPVERAVGAVQVGHPPVVGAEAERHRRIVSRKRVLHDLLDSHAAALDTLRAPSAAAAAAGHHGVRERHLNLQARLLAVVLIRPLRPRRVDRSHRPRGNRRCLSWGPVLAGKQGKPRSFSRRAGRGGSSGA
uniref:Uncharacterized protein n=1 Tax=Arundo donax TaxID=35708 RepID=A0A0A9FH98_ARUDO